MGSIWSLDYLRFIIVHQIITPSIDVIIKVADALEVSIDFLVGKTNLELDNQTLKELKKFLSSLLIEKIISLAS